MRDSVLFYRSFFEAICTLPDEERLKAYDYIIEYGLNEVEPEGRSVAYGIFLMARPQIDANNRRYQNGKKGGRPKTETEPENNQTGTEKEPKNNQAVSQKEPKKKDKEKDIKEILPNGSIKKSTDRFSPPAYSDVEKFCQENGYQVDANRFVDFYASKNWMVGKNKMKDWKAAVRNWERSQRQELTVEGRKRQEMTAAPNRFHNFKEHGYDYDDLMRRAIMQQKEG